MAGRKSEQEQQRHRALTRRTLMLGGVQLSLFGLLAGRLYQLQVLDAKRYQVLAEENRINVRLLAPLRGRILDRFGLSMAHNEMNYRITLTPEQAGDIGSTLDAIAALIPLDELDRHRVLRDIKRKYAFVPVVVRENVPWDELARIEVNMPDLPGIGIDRGASRVYPFAERASHVTGYVAPPSIDELTDDPLMELPDFRIGKSGLERAADLALRGVAGNSEVEVNAHGRVVREIAREEGAPGADLVSTLDTALQDFTQARISAEEAASCVVLDAVTGDVLAMASSPSYDANAFTAGLSQEVWQQLNADPHGPLYNKTTQGIYPPGSTFKPVVALAALESGLVTADFQVSCSGQMGFGDAVFHCWQKTGHGTLDLHGGIKNSCDVYFWQLALKIGIDRIADMAFRLGLGAPTGLDIASEHSGLVPTQAWKRKHFGARWNEAETLNAGIGQGYVTATPLQLATMLARLLTNRNVVPHLIRANGVIPDDPTVNPDRGVPAFDRLGFGESHLAAILAGMNAVCNEPGGTAYGARITDPGREMGGKSGTAQVRHISQAEREHGVRKGETLPWKERDHALFMAFAPVIDPRYVAAVVVEHGIGGSRYAAPIARDVLRECQRRDPGRRYPPADLGQPFDAASLAPPLPDLGPTPPE